MPLAIFTACDLSRRAEKENPGLQTTVQLAPGAAGNTQSMRAKLACRNRGCKHNTLVEFVELVVLTETAAKRSTSAVLGRPAEISSPPPCRCCEQRELRECSESVWGLHNLLQGVEGFRD